MRMINSAKSASILAGVAAAMCCSLVWLGTGLTVLLAQGGAA